MNDRDDPKADGELVATLQALRDEVRGLAGRVKDLEGCLAAAGIRPPIAPPAVVEPAPAAGITEDELLAISAAVALLWPAQTLTPLSTSARMKPLGTHSGASVTSVCASASIRPQLGVGGCAPRPT